MKQLALGIPGPRGGKRKGAGRPNLSRLQAHSRRPRLDRRHPVHVTLKLAPNLPSLRRKDIFKLLRAAVRKARQRGFAVAHFAILSNHIHLILEPKSASLATTLQSLTISFAKRLNGALAREGAVFRDRYHLRTLRTPTEVRHALNYVLTNDAHHRGGPAKVIRIDRFSSAFGYRDLRLLVGPKVKLEYFPGLEESIFNWLEELLEAPKSWLLRDGWKRARRSHR